MSEPGDGEQQRQRGSTSTGTPRTPAPAGSSGPAPGKATLTQQLELGGLGSAPSTAAPGKGTLTQRLAAPRAESTRGGAPSDAAALRAAILAVEPRTILSILERNADPERMSALCSAIGPGVADRLARVLDATDWARARVFLGEQVALDVQLATHDRDAIFRDLAQLSDARVLELFRGEATGPMLAGPIFGDAGARGSAPPTRAPAPTTLAEVQAVLRDQLAPDDAYRAMRLLLENAARAIAAPRAGAARGPLDLVVEAADLASGAPGGPLSLVLPSGIDPIAEARVALAEERIRAADAAGPRGDSQAFLALADLSASERKALAVRLRHPPLGLGSISDEIEAIAAMSDDASALQRAIQRAFHAAQVRGQVLRGPGLDAAIDRGRALLLEARARLAQVPPTAPEADRAAARAEVARLENMLFGAGAEGTAVRLALQSETDSDPERDPGLYAQKLRAMGADPVTVGSELLKRARVWEIDDFIATLKAIAPEHRAAALQASGRSVDLYLAPLSDTHRELIDAYLEQGSVRAEAGPLAADASMPVLHVERRSPDATIALHDILAWLDRGPSAAYLILSRLDGLTAPERKAVLEEPRLAARLRSLPEGEDASEARDFRETLHAVARTHDAATAIATYPGPGDDGGPWHSVQLEHLRAMASRAGSPNLRRAYVLRTRLARDPSLAVQLTAADRAALEALDRFDAETRYLDPSLRSAADEITFGAPQLVDTAEGAVDPNMEASFMLVRLRERAKVRDEQSLAEAGARPAVIEALAHFETLYRQVRPGGVSRPDLARLAEAYHRAARALDEDAAAVAENAGLAQLAATIAGVVVAVAVTAATGGALAPVATAALAGISAGTASAVAGAAVRWDDTAGAVLRDLGAGVVEGVATVAGAALASRIVRGVSAGLAAGRAATEVAGRAAARAGGAVAAKVAEGAIEGAVGGAAGELFQSAIDEATWDRGVASALATMLAALARGAAIGAGAGGAVGGLIGGLGRLARRSGDDVAQGVGHLLDASGVGRGLADDLADPAQDELAHALQLIESGRLDEAERVIHGIDGMPAKARAMLIEAARARAAIGSAGAVEAIELDGRSLWPRIVDDKEFRRLAGGKRADAMILIAGGEPQIITRRGAAPSAIREEVVHLHQWHGDPAMRQKMARLGEAQRGGWAALDPEQKLQLHIDKLEVEADAQRRLIAQLEHEVAEDPEAAMRLMDAEETLFLLGQRLHTLAGAGRAIDLAKLGIEDAPRLYARGAQSPTQITGWRARRARRTFVQQPTSIDDPGVERKLIGQGYCVHRDTQTGEIFRITRLPRFSAELPHLQIRDDRTIGLGEGVSTFAERKARAADEWTATGASLRMLETQLAGGQLDAKAAREARVYIQTRSPRVRAELERRVERGDLDEGTAGLVAKWGAVAERLETDSAAGAGKQFPPFTIGELLDQVPKGPVTEVHTDKLRRYLRERTLQYIESLERPQDRMEALHAMLGVQPDPGSKGELFHAYRERFMAAAIDEDGQAIYDVAKDAPGTFSGAGLGRPRRPDGVVTVKLQPDVEAHLPPGKYAIEDKTGPDAFKLDQARDYAKRAYDKAGGFKLTPQAKEAEYVGLVYVFSRESEAKAALKRMTRVPEIEKLLGRHPAGIHVIYFDGETGDLALATTLAPVTRGPL
jgi:hypothetical protein